MSLRSACACCLAISMVLGVPSAFAGKMELTTYYPAPYGEYKNLNSTEGSNFATTSGNVGIGTTNPQTKLDVVGDVKISGGTTTTDNLVVSSGKSLSLGGVAKKSWSPSQVTWYTDTGYAGSCASSGSLIQTKNMGIHDMCALGGWAFGKDQNADSGCRVATDAYDTFYADSNGTVSSGSTWYLFTYGCYLQCKAYCIDF